jgi:hypothetical protein
VAVIVAIPRSRAPRSTLTVGVPFFLLGAATGSLCLFLFFSAEHAGDSASALKGVHIRGAVARQTTARGVRDSGPPRFVPARQRRSTARPPTAQETAVQSADFIMRHHDKKIWAQVPARLEAAIFASKELQDCGFAYGHRQKVPRWNFRQVCLFDGLVENDTLRFRQVHCDDGSIDDAGDEIFRACAATSLAGIAVPCEGCRTGALSFPWPLQGSFRGPAPVDGTLSGTSGEGSSR